jgi:hypothetical protein
VVLQALKLDLLDWTFERLGLRSFADLGGTWAVEAGYTFHLLDHHDVDRGLLVDSGITDTVRSRAAGYPALELVDGFFGDPAIVASVGEVDALVLFDVLLHQVDPDWDEVLHRYAGQIKVFIIVNPQYTAGDTTIRLFELGADGYFANVPPEQIPIDFDNLDAIDPRYGRAVRDIHEIWQWGITDHDLIATMAGLDYTLVRLENAGRWRAMGNFDNVGFVFVRNDIWEQVRG